MGLDELLSTLKKNEQKQIADIWLAAKNEAATLRRHVAEEIEAFTRIHETRLASACQESMHAIFSEADIKTRTKKLFAYQALADSLQKTAAGQLPQLRKDNYDRIFAMLAAELPDRHWEKIIVNPADKSLAAHYFAADIISTAPAISGGLIAVTADGKITVDNSFEKRLERIWYKILPAIIEKIEQRHDKHDTAENSPGM